MEFRTLLDRIATLKIDIEENKTLTTYVYRNITPTSTADEIEIENFLNFWKITLKIITGI